MFDCCLKKRKYKGKFEYTYVSPSHVIVKRLQTGRRIILQSNAGYEIEKINIFQDEYIIAHTPETLLAGQLVTCKLSEVPWRGSGNEKFFFGNPDICMIFNAGELTLVEYGVNEVIGSCRTEFMSHHLISIRLDERKRGGNVKLIAYLVDLQTIHIQDLLTRQNIATVEHDAKIDWLELARRSNKLLFRDKRRQLHLYDIDKQLRTTLLSYCSFVQVLRLCIHCILIGKSGFQTLML